MASNPLHDLDLTGQLALDRPMLVARIDRPAAQLVLGNAPAPPKIDQTTMLRVILPLKPAESEDAKHARSRDRERLDAGRTTSRSRTSSSATLLAVGACGRRPRPVWRSRPAN